MKHFNGMRLLLILHAYASMLISKPGLVAKHSRMLFDVVSDSLLASDDGSSAGASLNEPPPHPELQLSMFW